MCYNCLAHVPTRLLNTGTRQPWVTCRIKQLSQKKQHLYNLARKSNCSRNCDSYQCFKCQVQRECRDAYNNYIKGLVDSNGTVSKRLWNFIKSQRKDHCGVVPLKVDDVVKLKYLINNYFTSVFTPVASQVLPEIHEEMKPDQSLLKLTVFLNYYSP